jgi:hypothetical protein
MTDQISPESETVIEAAAQALANDHWRPSVPLSYMQPSAREKYRRMARIVLEAAGLAQTPDLKVVMEILAKFHRNSCYPQASEGELRMYAEEIISSASPHSSTGRNINDVISTLPQARQDKIAERAAALSSTLLTCPRCKREPADKALLGSDDEGHICGTCWTNDRHAEDSK